MTARFGKLAWLWLSVLVIALDQAATKHWFEANFSLYQKVEVIPDYFARPSLTTPVRRSAFWPTTAVGSAGCSRRSPLA